MSLFAKKLEPQVSLASSRPEMEPLRPPAAPRRSYGVADLVRLMRSIPVDQDAEWVVRVIATTLASVDVNLSEIINDAAKQQKTIEDRMGLLEQEIEKLSLDIDQKREQITQLQTDLAEMITVKERLQTAENLPSPPTDAASAIPKGRSLPPPLPPPMPPPMRASATKPPESTT